MKVHLHNFQIHKDSEIDIAGLTGIIGTNNSGKSSLIRSLRDFVMNNFGEEKIRQGQKSGYISVDGFKLERNVKTSVLHLPDGKKLEKMAGQKLPKLIILPNFLYIDNSKISNLLPQFSFQKESSFPFNLSDAQTYSVFAMLFDIERLNKLFIYTKNKIKENTNSILYSKGKMDESIKMFMNLEEKKSKLPPIEDINKLEKFLQSYELVISHATILQNDKIKLEKIRKLRGFLVLKQYLICCQLQKSLEQVKFDESNEVILQFLEKKYRMNALMMKVELNKIELDKLEEQLSMWKICPLCGKQI